MLRMQLPPTKHLREWPGGDPQIWKSSPGNHCTLNLWSSPRLDTAEHRLETAYATRENGDIVAWKRHKPGTLNNQLKMDAWLNNHFHHFLHKWIISASRERIKWSVRMPSLSWEWGHPLGGWKSSSQQELLAFQSWFSMQGRGQKLGQLHPSENGCQINSAEPRLCSFLSGS